MALFQSPVSTKCVLNTLLHKHTLLTFGGMIRLFIVEDSSFLAILGQHPKSDSTLAQI